MLNRARIKQTMQQGGAGMWYFQFQTVQKKHKDPECQRVPHQSCRMRRPVALSRGARCKKRNHILDQRQNEVRTYFENIFINMKKNEKKISLCSQ